MPDQLPPAMPQPIRVLIVEDSEHDARLLVRELTKGGFKVAWTRVASEEQMRSSLESSEWDLVISDYSIPGFGGMEALSLHQQLRLDIPFIVVSGTVGEDVAVGCMREGAHDYLMKDQLTRLCEAVRRELREADMRRTHREASTALARSEERLGLVWENVEAGIILVDAATRDVIDINPVAAAMIGSPRGDIVGRQCHEFICPAERCKCPVLDLGQTVDRSERQLVRVDGSSLPVVKSVTPIELDGRQVLLESFVDIAKLREAQKALRVTQFVTDHAVEAVYWMGPDAQFLYVNDTACRCLGYSRDELLTMTVHDIDPNFPKEAWQQHWAELREKGSMVVESVHRAKDGREFPVEISLSYQVSEGEARNCAFARDITERRQAEARRALEARVLETLNGSNGWQNLLRDLLAGIKEFTEFDAVGLRLRDADDYPYYEYNGFSEDFVIGERYLCARDDAGEIVRDASGDPCLECMCGNVIRGRTDATLPCFTDAGSFWTNSTSALLGEGNTLNCQGRMRNECSAAGYESVTLIPLRSGDETIGLLQLNDRRPDRFTPDLIRFFEEIGHSIGIACTRRAMHEALEESERRLTTLLGNLPGMAYRCLNEPDRPMEFVSGGGMALTGYTPDELTDTEHPAYGELIHPEDRQRVWDTVQDALSQGQTFAVEYRLSDRQGAERWAWEQGQAVGEDSDGTVVMEGVIHDITERKRAEEHRRTAEAQLRQSQRLESIGTLAGGVAHEINNPINGIMNYAQLIRDELGQEPGELGEFACEIVHETERVAAIVKSLLQFARHDKRSHSPARVCDIVEGTSSLIRTVMRHDQITLSIDVPDSLPEIRCRSQQIQQVVMNLLTNARDALNDKYEGYDENKVIEVKALLLAQGRPKRFPCRRLAPDAKASDVRESPPALRSGDAVPPMIRITVADRGTGIPDRVRERMFDPFFTTKARDKGTGLGLAISHGIVKDHGGDMSVESKPGEYTRFHVDLPAAQPSS